MVPNLRSESSGRLVLFEFRSKLPQELLVLRENHAQSLWGSKVTFGIISTSSFKVTRPGIFIRGLSFGATDKRLSTSSSFGLKPTPNSASSGRRIRRSIPQIVPSLEYSQIS